MPCKNLDKALFFWETRYFVWKFENFDELQLSYSSIFFAETLHTFSTYQCLQKGVSAFFKFHLDLESFAKNKKDLLSTHSFSTLLLITQDLNNIKKIPHTFLYTLLSRKRVQNLIYFYIYIHTYIYTNIGFNIVSKISFRI